MTSGSPGVSPAADGVAATLGHEQHPVVARLDTGVALGSGARKGAAWAVGARVLGQVVQFAGTIATARLLLPSDFGVTAIIFPLLAFAGVFNSLGLGSSVIYADRVTEKLLSTVFWVHAAAGFVLWGLLAAASLPVAAVFGVPQLAPIMCLGGAMFAVNLSLVQVSLLERALRFKQIAVIEVSSTVIAVGAAVAAAVAGFGAYSLVLGPVVNQATITIGMWAAVRWRPRAWPDRQSIRELWTFTRGITGYNLLHFWSRNADNLLLGRFATLTELGYYNRAYNLMKVPVTQMNTVMGRVLFPTLARLRDDKARLGAAWVRALALASAVTAPITLTMAVTAPAMTEVLFGRRWLGMVTVLQLLALSALPQTLSTTVGGLLRATGATDVLFRRGVITAAMSLTAMGIGLPWGTVGVAAALTVKFYLELFVVLPPCLERTGLSWRDLVAAMHGVWLASLVLAAAGLAVRFTVADGTPAWQVLLMQLTACGVAYVAALWFLDRRSLLMAWGLLHRLVARASRRRSAPSASTASGSEVRADRQETPR